MAKMCEVCGKAPVFGNRVSHAHNVSSRRWLPNLQRVRVMVGSAVKRMNVCTRCIRTGKIAKAARKLPRGTPLPFRTIPPDRRYPSEMAEPLDNDS
jgi:large subunit ribosomal protein L28